VNSTVPIWTRRDSGTDSATSVAPAAHSPQIPTAVMKRKTRSVASLGASAQAPVPSENSSMVNTTVRARRRGARGEAEEVGDGDRRDEVEEDRVHQVEVDADPGAQDHVALVGGEPVGSRRAATVREIAARTTLLA